MKIAKGLTRHLLSCIAALTALHTAHAGRPLQTDDAGVIDTKGCELEGAAQRLKTTEGANTDQYPQWSCGVVEGTQLAARLTTAQSGDVRARGFAVGSKSQIWKSPAGGDLAFTLGLAWNRESGSGMRFSNADTRLVYSQPALAGTTVHVNLGHTRDVPGNRNASFWGLALEHEGFGPVAPMAELYSDGTGSARWNLALRFTLVPDKVFVDASHGRQTGNGQPPLTTVRFKLAF
jgi:hypothetical protein